MRPLVINQKITARETDSFKQYLKEVLEIEVFSTPEAEQKCAEKAWNGDIKAREELVNRNLRFVISCAKQFQNKGVSLEDLVNEGNMGLLNAAQRFDPSKGFKFISYAVWYIRKDIISYITNNSRTIRIPNNKVDAISKFKEKIITLEQELQRSVCPEDMMERYGVEYSTDANGDVNVSTEGYTKEDIEVLFELINNDISSLDTPIGDDGYSSLYDLLEDSSMDKADVLVARSDMKINVNMLLSKLKPIEREIIVKLYGLDGTPPSTLSDVGNIFDLSRETVRQKRDRAFKTIQHKFRASAKNILND